MDDTISRQAAIDALSQYPFEKVVNYISILEELPSAQPERKKGMWSKSDDGYECSECEWYSLYDSPWCPWCGAKMKVLKDDD